MATTTVDNITDVTLDCSYDNDEIVVRFKKRNGKMSKKVLVVQNNGTVIVYEDEIEPSKSVRPFKKAFKTGWVNE